MFLLGSFQVAARRKRTLQSPAELPNRTRNHFELWWVGVALQTAANMGWDRGERLRMRATGEISGSFPLVTSLEGSVVSLDWSHNAGNPARVTQMKTGICLCLTDGVHHQNQQRAPLAQVD